VGEQGDEEAKTDESISAQGDARRTRSGRVFARTAQATEQQRQVKWAIDRITELATYKRAQAHMAAAARAATSQDMWPVPDRFDQAMHPHNPERQKWEQAMLKHLEEKIKKLGVVEETTMEREEREMIRLLKEQEATPRSGRRCRKKTQKPPPPRSAKPRSTLNKMRSRWVFARKKRAHEVGLEYSARICACGYSQKEGQESTMTRLPQRQWPSPATS
jgi:hypothetical protein